MHILCRAYYVETFGYAQRTHYICPNSKNSATKSNNLFSLLLLLVMLLLLAVHRMPSHKSVDGNKFSTNFRAEWLWQILTCFSCCCLLLLLLFLPASVWLLETGSTLVNGLAQRLYAVELAYWPMSRKTLFDFQGKIHVHQSPVCVCARTYVLVCLHSMSAACCPSRVSWKHSVPRMARLAHRIIARKNIRPNGMQYVYTLKLLEFCIHFACGLIGSNVYRNMC